jgi:hypothetical protein
MMYYTSKLKRTLVISEEVRDLAIQPMEIVKIEHRRSGALPDLARQGALA